MLILVCVSCVIFAQTTQEREKKQIADIQSVKSFYLKINPVKWVQGPIPLIAEFGASVEGVVTNNFSYQIGAGYLHKSILFNTIQSGSNGLSPRDFSFSGYRIETQIRCYPFESNKKKDQLESMKPEGFFVGLNGSYSTAILKLTSQRYPQNEFTNSNLTLAFGSQILATKTTGFEYFILLGVKQNTLTETDYLLNKKQLDLEDNGMTPYYASNYKIGFGFNVTFGIL